MKKILLILLLSVFLIPTVKAEESFTTIEASMLDYIPFKDLSGFTGCYSDTNCPVVSNMRDLYLYNDFKSFYKDPKNKSIFDELYLNILDYYKLHYEQSYPYYFISVVILSTSSSEFRLNTLAIKLTYNRTSNFYQGNDKYSIYNLYSLGNNFPINESGDYTGIPDFNPDNFAVKNLFNNGFPLKVGYGDFASSWFYTPLYYFQSNFDWILANTTTVFKTYDKDNNLIFDITSGDIVPPFRNNSPLVSYTLVDLNDYEYVILSLKDYEQKEAFTSNLRVKGMIGITPVYEFGTIEKNDVTDRCNNSFSDLTDYTLYILENDLINNAIYYVKACEKDSLLEFDNTTFNVTYVTSENKDNPVISFGGVDYNVIPFDKLTTTANSNEENNFVPGANTEFKPFEAVADYVSSFWNALTTFMGLVTKFFNTLPIEIRAISITAFTTALTLGVIKFIKS